MKAGNFAISQAGIREEQSIVLEGDSRSLISAIKGRISGRGPFAMFWKIFSVNVKRACSRTRCGFKDKVMKLHIGLQNGLSLLLQLLYGQTPLPSDWRTFCLRMY